MFCRHCIHGLHVLRGQSRTFMNEEITQCDIRIAEIGAECILTEEIVKSAACRMFTKESTALVAGAVELGISVFNILL